METATPWDATLTLLRWRQTRRGYDGDDVLLATACALLTSGADGAYAALRHAEAKCNIPADRIATELIHLALLLVTKPKRDAATQQSRAVLKLLHLGLKALRATGDSGAALAIPTNACNLLLAAMADTLESVQYDDDDASGEETVVDVLQIFVFLFGMAAKDGDVEVATPSFNMYKPPTNVYTAFMQRAYSAVFAQIDQVDGQRERVALLHAVMRVFQELQFTQVNKKKVFVAIAKTSFRDIAGFRHALLQHKQVNGVMQVLQVLDRIIVDALFDSEHLREYDGALVHLRMWQNADESAENEEGAPKHKNKKQRRKQGSNDKGEASSLVSYQRHLFDELKAFLGDASVSDDSKESIGSLLELLVQGFAARIRAAANDKVEDSRADLKTSKKRVANVIATTSTTYSPFKFWAELCGVAFGAFEALQGKDGDAAQSVLVCVYDSLFKALCDSDVYRVTEDTEEQEQFHMMQTILSRFVELLRAGDYSGHASAIETTSRVCRVLSNAVRCTPNLVNSSLVSIFDVLGGCSGVADASSASMVELLRAYESMRLVDAFLRACCSTDDDDVRVASGLLAIFSHSTTEAALRRTYMTLPPGQLEIVWRQLTDKLAVLCGSRDGEAVATKMALVRSLFAVFLQEIHITPQNRAKIGELVTESHDKLLATLGSRVSRFQVVAKEKPKASKKKASNSASFSVVERELFSVFGEFLALYDGLAPGVRTQTLDVVLAALETKLLPVMASLLTGENDHGIVGAAAGIVKIGVHRLRRHADGDAAAIATLIVDRVIEWKCWNAVAFYLPELVQGVVTDRAAALYVELVRSFLAVEGSSAQAAARILRDAAFYEIAELQRVASSAITTVLNSEEIVQDDHAVVLRLFEHLLTIPTDYTNASDVACGALLAAALRVHQSIAQRDDLADTATLASVSRWIERYLAVLASSDATSDDVKRIISQWAAFVLLDAISFRESSARLVSAAVAFLASPTAGAQAHTALDNALTKLLAQQTARGRETCATVLEAVARLQEKNSVVAKFVDQLVAKIESTPSIVASLESDASFQLLTALVTYVASLPEDAASARRTKVAALLQTHIGPALASAMQGVVAVEPSQSSSADTMQSSRHRFFVTFCRTFHLLRSTVTLETFGCLLVAALVLASSSSDTEETDKPLASLVQHANKDEFRLLAVTVLRELRVPRAERAVAALKALAFALETDKKLSASRRQVLGEFKMEFVGLFVQLFSRTLHSSPADTIATSTTTLCVWNLRVFVLFYCKAELFTWKPHELLQIFAGFQPLAVLAASLSAKPDATTSLSHWTSEQLHQVWLLSYNLLLRIVRHHFASLVNGVSHMVDALTALLRVLVATSASTQNAAHALEWGANLARLYGYLKTHDAALRKHVVYLLFAYLRGVTQGRLSLALQQRLRPGVFALLEMCSLFEKEQLYASLDATGKSLLKSLDTSYKLTYRYAGKV